MPDKTLKGRSLARAQAFQILFQSELCARSVEDVLDGREFALETGPIDPYAEELARGAASLLEQIDALLERCSFDWALTRMPFVDRNIMRLAVYEMVAISDVDVSVTIDEAVELAKRYGSDDSSKFVNGVLGRIAEDLEAGIDVLA